MRSISSHISRPRCGVQIIVLQARVSPNSAALHSLHRTRSPRLPAALRAHGTRRACSRPEGRRVLVRPGLTPPPSSPPSTNQPSCTTLPGPSLDPRCRKPRLRPHCRSCSPLHSRCLWHSHWLRSWNCCRFDPELQLEDVGLELCFGGPSVPLRWWVSSVATACRRTCLWSSPPLLDSHPLLDAPK